MATEQSFTAALLDPDLPVPAGLVAHHGRSPQRRFNIYRNNVFVSLTEALGASFPVVRQMVGNEFFAAMARAFIERNPPRSPILSRYGDNFPGFIADFQPAGGLPYLSDLARLEMVQVEAFHALDSAPLQHEKLAAAPQGDLDRLCFVVHPAARLLASPFPVAAIWMAHHGQGTLEAIDLALPEWVLVTRPDVAVEIRSIRPGCFRFLSALAAGQTLAAASAEALRCDADFDLTESLCLALESGAFSQLLIQGDGTHEHV